MTDDEQIAADIERVRVALQLALDAAEDEARQFAVAYPQASAGRNALVSIADGISKLCDRMVRRR